MKKFKRPILFLLRLLKEAETRYWPTELEIAGFCWTVAKLRYMIEASRQSTVIYTDYASTIQIATQININTIFLIRMNNRHLRFLEYLSRFRLEVRHFPGRENVISDALSRLLMEVSQIIKSQEDPLPPVISDSLDEVYPIFVVEFNEVFLDKIKDGY